MDNSIQTVPEESSSNGLKNKLVKSAKWLGLVVIGLYSLVWLSSPMVAHYILSDIIYEQYGLRLSEETSIRYNPFTSHLSVQDLAIYGEVTRSEKVASVESDSSNNKKVQSDTPVFSLKQFDTEVRLHRLLTDELYVSELSLNGLFVSIKQTEETVFIAGIDLKQLTASQDTDIQADMAQSETPVSDVGNLTDDNETLYSLVLPTGSIESVNAEISTPNGKHSVSLNKLDLIQVLMSKVQQELSSHLALKLNNAPLTVSLTTKLNNNSGTIEFGYDLKEFELSTLQSELSPYFETLAGKLSISNKQVIKLSETNVSVESRVFELNMADVHLANPEFDIRYKDQAFSISNLKSEIGYENDELVVIEPARVEKVSFMISELLGELGDNQVSSKMQSIEVHQITIAPSSEAVSNSHNLAARIESILYQPEDIKYEAPSQSLHSNGFSISATDILVDKQVNSIEQIVVDGIDASFKLKSKPDVEVIQNQTEKTAEKQDLQQQDILEQQSVDSSENSAVALKLGTFELVNSEEISFIDESREPNFKRSLVIESAKLTSLDSSLPMQPSPFLLAGKSDQYTKFDFKGAIKPFTEKVNLELQGSLNEFSLPPASSYIQSLLGFEIESGELDTKLDIKIVESQIEGETGIKIRGLALASAENYDQDVIQEQTAMPLNMALGMLKDSDDNVELEIPMLGNLDSPTFGVGSFVSLVTKKAIQSAAKSYLITTFLPYSDVISMTISAGEFIMKTRFEDLIYQPGQKQLSDSQQEYFEQFVALMKDKESTQVKVCGIATRADLPENSEADATNPDTNTDINNTLKDIASLRMTLFKEEAVKQGVQSSRILLCAPKVDLSEDSKPRLVLSV